MNKEQAILDQKARLPSELSFRYPAARPHGAPMTERAVGVRWRTTRTGFQRYEVFTVEGVEYRRAAGPETADLTIPMKTRGLAPLYLRRLENARNLKPKALDEGGKLP